MFHAGTERTRVPFVIFVWFLVDMIASTKGPT